MTPELENAYAACRAIAREQAKNFYYAFVALPSEKRNAICAVYAFMRRADDLSDDESMSRASRRVALDQWLAAWRAALAGGATADPVFVALMDAQRRFAIPETLLEELVAGTAMDLMDVADRGEAAPELQQSSVQQSSVQQSLGQQSSAQQSPAANGSLPAALATYPTFADLYQYCYLVASVVGLVCIRIFGYRDSRAEKLAEETGVAFQLTNILRDVREDAERGRLYLPLEDLERRGVAPEEFLRITDGRNLTPAQRAVLEIEAGRAEDFYQSAHMLLPLIAPDSRPALWVLVTIYHRLLVRIESRNFDVFSAKISVPVYEKLAILGWGILKTMLRTG